MAALRRFVARSVSKGEQSKRPLRLRFGWSVDMRLTLEFETRKQDAGYMALDWETLGRLVRARTLEAVAVHFAVQSDRANEVDQSIGCDRDRFAE